ncbi:unnamed protein product [Prorocentrum cordatum]|uniref:Uncharacterized protein n=1 Tax=Prorocentrum cordatum TaxID=2364126 RepID=A0ABN9U385_9DINO|nr:unnamed protein product [Polarella glacialis]
MLDTPDVQAQRQDRGGWWCSLKCFFAVLVGCGGILVLAACFGLPADSLDWRGAAPHEPSPASDQPSPAIRGDVTPRSAVEQAVAAAVVPVTIPTFAFSSYSQSITTPLCKPNFDVWRNKFLEMFWTTLENHSARTDEGSATLSLVCCFRSYQYIYDRDCNESDVVDRAQSRFNSLPVRSPESPYLVLAWGLEVDEVKKHAWAHDLIRQRDDFLYMHFDLRGHYKYNEAAPMLPGITIAPPLFWKGPQANLSRPPKYFLTFSATRKRDPLPEKVALAGRDQPAPSTTGPSSG